MSPNIWQKNKVASLLCTPRDSLLIPSLDLSADSSLASWFDVSQPYRGIFSYKAEELDFQLFIPLGEGG